MRFRLFCGVMTLSTAALAQQPGAAPPARASQGRDWRWDRVARVMPGESIEVRDRATGVRTDCVLDSVTEAELYCHSTEPSGAFHSQSFLKIEIDRVWMVRSQPKVNRKLILFATAVGGALGGSLLSQGGAKDAAFGVLLGAGVVGGYATVADDFHRHVYLRRIPVYVAH